MTAPAYVIKKRVYEISRGESANIATFDKLVLVVKNVDECIGKVWFDVNPNIVEYRETARSQSIGYETTEDSLTFCESPNTEPLRVIVQGTAYQIVVDSVGTEGERHWPYCDFVVSW